MGAVLSRRSPHVHTHMDVSRPLRLSVLAALVALPDQSEMDVLSAIYHLNVPELKQQHVTITPLDLAPRLVYQDIGGIVWRSLKIDTELYPLIEYRHILKQPELTNRCAMAQERVARAITNLRHAALRQQVEDNARRIPVVQQG